MFCQICGANLRTTAHFCNRCGKPVQQRFGGASTAEQALDSAPTTPELSPKPQTDQNLHRGTEPQPPTKATGKEVAQLPGPPPALPPYDATVKLGAPTGAITNVSTRLPDELPSAAAAPPLMSTEMLQQSAEAKPFFTQMITPSSGAPVNPQHRRLALAVPLVVLALILLLIFAYIASK